MKTNRILLGVLFLACQISFGQTNDEKLLRGKIKVDSVGINGINVLNLKNGTKTQTNSAGEFFILAKANEALGFLRVNLKNHKEVGCDVPIRVKCIN